MRRSPAPHDYDGWVAHLGHSGTRPRAKQYLFSVGTPAVPALRRGLGHPDPTVRRLCVNLLDHFVDEDAVADLVSALDDADPAVAARALHSLACDRCKVNECRPGEDQWVPRALELIHDPNPDLRAAAIDALGKVAGRRPQVAAALGAVAVTDPDKGLRGMARRQAPAAVGG